MTPLPKPNIDTGAGLERLVAVVQGVTSNYETDLFEGPISLTEEMSGKSYGSAEKEGVAFRVISDHARAATFLISDGILPSNEGRGYVLKRIIRRAIRFGQVLDLNEPFLHLVCNKVIEVMGPDFTELIQSKSFIEGVVKNEEKRFADTLFYGMNMLNEEIQKIRADGSEAITGEVAFKLYDTYGLSLDILEDVARDENLAVDHAGYEKAMSRQRVMSQESWQGSGEEEIPQAVRGLLNRGIKTRFLGYDTLDSGAKVVAILVDGEEKENVEKGTRAEFVLDQTPFYGQAGGQVGDMGLIAKEDSKFKVVDTAKFSQDLIIHKGTVKEGMLSVGDELEARVDLGQRKATALNHSATHLLHAALREVLGDHVKQAGSLVAADRLRFDFSHFTQTSAESLKEVENIVNKYIRDNMAIQTEVMSKDEAVKTGAMAIFEERYGESVRVVRMGHDVSMELCGGTHTRRTGDIGLFRIISEGAVGANVRRIEALTGEAAVQYCQAQDSRLRRAASFLRTTPEDLGERLEKVLKEQKEKEKEIESLKARLLSKKSSDLLTGVREISGVKVVSKEMDAESPKELRESADRIKDKLGSGVICLGAKKDKKAMLTCVVTRDLLDRYKAGDIVKYLSGILGGRGGGRPDMAQGGGDKPEKLKEALEALYPFLEKTET